MTQKHSKLTLYARCLKCGEEMVRVSATSYHWSYACINGHEYMNIVRRRLIIHPTRAYIQKLADDCKREYKQGSDSEYHWKNRDNILEKKKQYYLNNYPTISKKALQYYRNNRVRILEYARGYRDKHKMEISIYQAQYRANHKDKSKEYAKSYYQNHKEKIKKRSKEYKEWRKGVEKQ